MAWKSYPAWALPVLALVVVASGCQSQQSRPHVATATSVAVVALGVPSGPQFYDANPLNFVPLINMVASEADNASLGKVLDEFPPSMQDGCGAAMADALRRQGLKVVPVVAGHKFAAGVPQLLTEDALQKLASNGIVLDWIIQQYGFTISKTGQLQVSMQGTARLTEATTGRVMYYRRVHYRPTLLAADSEDLVLAPLPALPSWRSASDLKASGAQAKQALITVCAEMASIIAREMS